MKSEGEIAEQIALDWSIKPIPDVDDLKLLYYEYGENFYNVFAGKNILEVELDDLDDGSGLTFMSPKAALYYLASHMLAVLKNLPKRRNGYFVLDQLLMSQLIGNLGDLRFIETMRAEGMSKKQAKTIADFLDICIASKDYFFITDSECQSLQISRDHMRCLKD